MDPRLLEHYNRELQYIREMGGEFAEEYPKVAGRLGLEGLECADPYVERLLEGFAFLAARVQLQISAEFPRFTQHLLEIVYPNYLSPTPSMAVVQLQPDLAEGSLAAGFPVPRGTVLRSAFSKGDKTACEYRTAHDLALWPLEIVEAQYFSSAGALAAAGVVHLSGAKAGIRLRLRTTANLKFNQLALDSLVLYLRGTGEVPKRIHEQLLGHNLGGVVQSRGVKESWNERLDASQIRRRGFDDAEGLLPAARHAFKGYRLLQEYFAFPERFLFVEIAGLAPALRRCAESELDVTILLDSADLVLADVLNAENVALHCTPIVNLVPKRATRIHLDDKVTEYHVVPDRTRPMDFEVYSVSGVTGYGRATEPEQEFQPFYAANDFTRSDGDKAYYAINRSPRVLSARQRKAGSRTSYVGSEVYVSLVDGHSAPYRSSLRQIEVNTLCTNRDLPLQIPLGRTESDFSLDTGAPVQSIRCLTGPTRPLPSRADGDVAWRLISQLSLNYLSIVDAADGQGATALRELLSLYADSRDASIRQQIEGIRSVSSRTITRRIPTHGPVTYGRGLEIALTCEDGAYVGTGTYLLGSVLEEFFARYTSLNSFTETVMSTVHRGEVMRWPARLGRRQTL